MKRMTLPLMCLLLSACASTDYEAYLSAQQSAIREAQTNQKPLFELEAEPGLPITGLRAVRVYMPVQAPVLQQSRPSEWAGVLGTGLQVLGVVAGIKYSGEAAANLAREVGGAASHGYQYVQSPQPNQRRHGHPRERPLQRREFRRHRLRRGERQHARADRRDSAFPRDRHAARPCDRHSAFPRDRHAA